MFYKYAMEYGDCEGTIRCAYAMFYNEHGQRVFSLQRKNFDLQNMTAHNLDLHVQNDPNYLYQWTQDQWGNAVYTGVNGKGDYYKGESKQGIFYWDAGGWQPTGFMQINFPVVVARKWSGEPLVPVTLVEEAANYIKETINKAQKSWRFAIWNVYDKNTLQLLYTSYKKKYIDQIKEYQDESKYIIQKEKGIHPLIAELKKGIDKNTVFYIKPAAFVWHPINLKNKPIVETTEIKQKKVDLDRARMAVILAGGLTLI